MANRVVVFSGVTPDEMDRLRVGIKVKYPDAPPLTGDDGSVDVGHGYTLAWAWRGAATGELRLTITGGVVFIGIAKKQLVGLVQEIIGEKQLI